MTRCCPLTFAAAPAVACALQLFGSIVGVMTSFDMSNRDVPQALAALVLALRTLQGPGAQAAVTLEPGEVEMLCRALEEVRVAHRDHFCVGCDKSDMAQMCPLSVFEPLAAMLMRRAGVTDPARPDLS